MNNKREEIHDLSKIPDTVLIKQLDIELGKANACIAELEEQVSNLKILAGDDKEIKLAIKREEAYQAMKAGISGEIKVWKDRYTELLKDHRILLNQHKILLNLINQEKND